MKKQGASISSGLICNWIVFLLIKASADVFTNSALNGLSSLIQSSMKSLERESARGLLLIRQLNNRKSLAET